MNSIPSVLFLLPGIVFGAAEFYLTKVIADRALGGRTPLLLVVLKLASYAAVLVPVFLLLSRENSLWFGIGAGGGVLLGGVAIFAILKLREKR